MHNVEAILQLHKLQKQQQSGIISKINKNTTNYLTLLENMESIFHLDTTFDYANYFPLIIINSYFFALVTYFKVARQHPQK